MGVRELFPWNFFGFESTIIMTNYFVVTPGEAMPEKEFLARRDEFLRRGAKVMAIVFNCVDRKDFQRKYFGEEIGA